MSNTDRFTPFSLSRVWTLATATMTQLVRMRILVFLAVFCAVVVVAGFFFPVLEAEQQLKLLKDVSFGALQIFSIVIAVAATALLLPRDLEDRTLYTILSKPVPRLEYLIGKFLGVMLLIGVSLIIMDIVLSGVLYLRQNAVLDQVVRGLEHEGRATPEAIAEVGVAVAKQGLTWNLHLGVVAVFLKAAVITGVALLLSCLASSTLFTVVSAFCIVIIGHGQGLIREFFFERHLSQAGERLASGALAILCPDLGMFDVVENVIGGQLVSLGAMGALAGMTLLYVTGHMVVSYLLFVEKEL
jgi:ABC-type transport system involved in multi-copper enzyme maturation permease subunit